MRCVDTTIFLALEHQSTPAYRQNLSDVFQSLSFDNLPMNITDQPCDLSKETAMDPHREEFQRVRNQVHSCLEEMQRAVVARIVRLLRLCDRFNDDQIQEILHDLGCTSSSVDVEMM